MGKISMLLKSDEVPEQSFGSDDEKNGSSVAEEDLSVENDHTNEVTEGSFIKMVLGT
jgi:hypothetical protein